MSNNIALLLLSYFVTWILFERIKFNFLSVRGIVFLTFFFFYPGVITLYYIATFFHLIEDKFVAMHVTNTIVAYLVLFSIFLVTELLVRDNKINETYHSTSDIRILSLSLFFFLILFLRLYLGLYYHVSIDPEYNNDVNYLQNIFNILHWVGILPVFVFYHKYITSKKNKYLFISVFIATLYVFIYLPSGSRTTAFLFLPLLFLFILDGVRSNSKKILISIIAFITLSFLIVFSGKLRVIDDDFAHLNFNDDVEILIHRLSDSIITGKIISIIPSEFNHRYTENLEAVVISPLPYFIRSSVFNYPNLLDGVNYAWSIGLSPPWTSVPVTILGDLYSRFGWGGILFFSFVLALALKLLDNILNSKSVLFRLIFLVLFFSFSSQIYLLDLGVLFTVLTRQFLVIFVLASLMTIFCSRSRPFYKNRS